MPPTAAPPAPPAPYAPPGAPTAARRAGHAVEDAWAHAARTVGDRATDERASPGGLLVGTDGRPETIAPLRVAAALAARTGEPVHVVTALGDAPLFAPGFEPLLPEVADAGAARLRTVRRLAREAAGDAASEGDRWTFAVRDGLPAPLLARVATERGARLTVVGLGLRRLRDRLLGGETALRIARHAVCPVLAVAPDARRLAESVVVAMDFGAAAVAAARAAIAVLGEHGTVYLVHVRPPAGEPAPPRTVPPFLPGEPSAVKATAAGYPDGLDPWFDRLAAELAPPPQVLLRPVVLRGGPAEVLLDFADRVRADLVAAGTQGPAPVQRLFVGSVSTALVRSARCSVLLAPPILAGAAPPTGPAEPFAAAAVG